MTVAYCGLIEASTGRQTGKDRPGGIVVGVDGSKESIAALNSAAAVSRMRRRPLHAVTVLGPLPTYTVNPEVDERGDHLRIALKDSELHVIMSALEPPESWTHEVVIGRPARLLTTIAEQRAADLIVVGRREHSLMDRVLGNETALQIMRTSRVPVLAVSNEILHPKTIVVAIDFSDPSEMAAQLAYELVRVSGTVYLVHVESSVTTAGEKIPDGEGRFPGDVIVWFRRLMGALPTRNGVLVEPIVLTGSVGRAIADFAERVGADLIAAGSHGRNKFERFLLGSVSTELVREARCSVLIAPPV